MSAPEESSRFDECKCALCENSLRAAVLSRIDPYSPLGQWRGVFIAGTGQCFLCERCAGPILEAERIGEKIKREAEANLADALRARLGYPSSDDRVANLAFARACGIWWGTCPRCGREYGAHERDGDSIPCLLQARVRHCACCPKVSDADDERACRAKHAAETP